LHFQIPAVLSGAQSERRTERTRRSLWVVGEQVVHVREICHGFHGLDHCPEIRRRKPVEVVHDDCDAPIRSIEQVDDALACGR
jgi:hypothetical protein